MKISVIVTVLNEEKTISFLLGSLLNQTLEPNEIIICDGDSTDDTAKLIKNYKTCLPARQEIKLLIKKGNRSVCRNLAIKKAKNNWIAITDAGCIPDKNWLKNLAKKQLATNALIVAGYYKGLAKTNFEKAVIPYVLIMPNRINHDSFLPATRSMLINKKVWQNLRGFDEKLSLNEDYDFALKIKNNYKIAFAKKAIVGWMPRKNLFDFTKMIFNFAKGDVQANIFRPKVILIFLRYFFGIILLSYSLISNNLFLILLLSSFLVLYILWSITKNYTHTKQGWFYLPILQIVSDLAVMTGSIMGLIKVRL
jgi:glycosyltransferase involved in cell wall biosynthesis